MIQRIIIPALLIVVITYAIVYGAARLAVDMYTVEKEVLNVSELFPSTIESKFVIVVPGEEGDEVVDAKLTGTFKGVKILRQVGSERIPITSLIIENTVINLESYGLETNISYKLCIQPYYDFGEQGIKNVVEMSEYNFRDYTIKYSIIDAPDSITIIF